MEPITGCGSHSCDIAKPQGMGTNGPCHCLEGLAPEERRRVRRALQSLRASDALLARIREECSAALADFKEADERCLAFKTHDDFVRQDLIRSVAAKAVVRTISTLLATKGG